jgi:hypothetical protein
VEGTLDPELIRWGRRGGQSPPGQPDSGAVARGFTNLAGNGRLPLFMSSRHYVM